MFLAFLTWQFAFFCIAIGAVVYVFRLLAEYMMENVWPFSKWASVNKEQKLWRGFILPVLPVLVGQLMAFLVTSYPYPEGFNTSGTRWIFGLVAGFSSGLIVKIYNEVLSGKLSDLAVKALALLSSVKSAETKSDKEAGKE